MPWLTFDSTKEEHAFYRKLQRIGNHISTYTWADTEREEYTLDNTRYVVEHRRHGVIHIFKYDQ